MNIESPEFLQWLLSAVCVRTGTNKNAVLGKSRIWPLMYARYLFFDIAIRCRVPMAVAIQVICRGNKLIYPYRKNVMNLRAVDKDFSNVSDELFEEAQKLLANE